MRNAVPDCRQAGHATVPRSQYAAERWADL
jgi:hypothetical protein